MKILFRENESPKKDENNESENVIFDYPCFQHSKYYNKYIYF